MTVDQPRYDVQVVTAGPQVPEHDHEPPHPVAVHPVAVHAVAVHAVAVHAAAVHAAGLLAGALPRTDWSDAYTATWPSGSRIDPQVWADAIFHCAPLWVRKLLAVRQAIVVCVGIDRGRPDTFATRARTDDEVLLGTDERHLSFRVSLLSLSDGVVLSTIVQLHNRRGRAYFAVVRHLHPLIVRSVLGRAARQLSTNQGVLR